MRPLKTMLLGILLIFLLAAGWVLRGFFGGGQAGAGDGAAAMAMRGGAPEVVAATLQEAALRKPSEYVGHVEAIQEAEISAQVSGTIKSLHFKEGAVVQEGDLLFTIDPKVYQAKVDLEEATLAQTRSTLVGARASLKSVQAQLTYARQYLKRLNTAGSRSVVQADVDKAKSEVLRYEASEQEAEAQIQQLEAQVRQAEANQEVARIDLGYTQVRAPITGRIGRAEVSVGDYVSPGSVMLARVVQVSPVRVRFAISDREYLNIIKKNTQAGLNGLKASLQLPNGDAYQSEGSLDFVDNRMDQGTGTIVVRMLYENLDDRLVPDSYVRVLMERPGPRSGVMVPQTAIMTDQKGEYVYVVEKGNLAAKRYLTLGEAVDDKRVVNSGLEAGETVIVQGLQKVRPGQPVKIADNIEQSAEKGRKS